MVIGEEGVWRRCGEPEVVFLFRSENVFSCVVNELRRFLNVRLFRLAATAARAFSLPFGRRRGRELRALVAGAGPVVMAPSFASMKNEAC
jgi:hypothetical protein